MTALQTFRARHTSAINRNAALKASTPNIDLAYYKNILKDATVISQAEKVLNEFKPVDYDVKKWDDAVSAFEAKAVSGFFVFGVSEVVAVLVVFADREWMKVFVARRFCTDQSVYCFLVEEIKGTEFRLDSGYASSRMIDIWGRRRVDAREEQGIYETTVYMYIR